MLKAASPAAQYPLKRMPSSGSSNDVSHSSPYRHEKGSETERCFWGSCARISLREAQREAVHTAFTVSLSSALRLSCLARSGAQPSHSVGPSHT